MEEAAENGKELSYSAHGSGLNEYHISRTLCIILGVPCSYRSTAADTATLSIRSIPSPFQEY
jgi:hypothetical protein